MPKVKKMTEKTETTPMWNITFKSANDGVTSTLSMPEKDVHVIAEILKEALEKKGIEVSLKTEIQPEVLTSKEELNDTK